MAEPDEDEVRDWFEELGTTAVTETVSNLLGLEGPGSSDIVEDVVENAPVRVRYLRAAVGNLAATLSGASKDAERLVGTYEQHWRTATGRLYSRASTRSQVDAVDLALRDGYRADDRMSDQEGSAERRLYGVAFRQGRRARRQFGEERKQVRDRVGLLLSAISGDLASRRLQQIGSGGTTRVTGSSPGSVVGTAQGVETIRRDLKALADSTDDTARQLQEFAGDLEPKADWVLVQLDEVGEGASEMAARIHHADEAIEVAVQALAQAAQRARDFGERL